MSRLIMVVDDDDTERTYVTNILSNHGYEVITMSDSAYAVAAAALGEPQLIVLGLSFPTMDQSVFLGMYSQLAELRVPIVALVSPDVTLQITVARCLRGYVDRPFTAVDLIQGVEKTFSRQEIA
jgi:CheY-like chemotaxis protein